MQSGNSQRSGRAGDGLSRNQRVIAREVEVAVLPYRKAIIDLMLSARGQTRTDIIRVLTKHGIFAELANAAREAASVGSAQ